MRYPPLNLAERPGWGHAVFSEPLLAILYKTVGREADADEIMDDLMARGARGPYFALALRETGHVPEARAMIEAIDAAPASILAGSFMFQELGGTVAFDLDWTPHFAARLAEAGITVEMFDFD